MQAITKDTIIADIINMDIAEQAMPLLQSIGMHCLGCVMANRESLGQACMAHGVDADELVTKLTAMVKQ